MKGIEYGILCSADGLWVKVFLDVEYLIFIMLRDTHRDVRCPVGGGWEILAEQILNKEVL
jgi:hypothetical protein